MFRFLCYIFCCTPGAGFEPAHPKGNRLSIAQLKAGAIPDYAIPAILSG